MLREEPWSGLFKELALGWEEDSSSLDKFLLLAAMLGLENKIKWVSNLLLPHNLSNLVAISCCPAAIFQEQFLTSNVSSGLLRSIRSDASWPFCRFISSEEELSFGNRDWSSSLFLLPFASLHSQLQTSQPPLLWGSSPFLLFLSFHLSNARLKAWAIVRVAVWA